jgi:hypothetical protein
MTYKGTTICVPAFSEGKQKKVNTTTTTTTTTTNHLVGVDIGVGVGKGEKQLTPDEAVFMEAKEEEEDHIIFFDT